MLQMLYGNSCSIINRERVIGPALAPILDEFVTDCSKEVDSQTVSIDNVQIVCVSLWAVTMQL